MHIKQDQHEQFWVMNGPEPVAGPFETVEDARDGAVKVDPDVPLPRQNKDATGRIIEVGSWVAFASPFGGIAVGQSIGISRTGSMKLKIRMVNGQKAREDTKIAYAPAGRCLRLPVSDADMIWMMLSDFQPQGTDNV